MFYKEAHDILNSREGAIGSQWFGAAAIVTQRNAVGAAESFNIFSGAALFVETKKFLIQGNEFLFNYNVPNFLALRDGVGIPGMESLSGKELDYALVKFEQTKVQEFLDGFQWGSTRRNNVIRNINDQFSSPLAPRPCAP